VIWKAEYDAAGFTVEDLIKDLNKTGVYLQFVEFINTFLGPDGIAR